MEKFIKKKKALVFIPHWRDEESILKRIKKLKKRHGVTHSDVMRKLVRDGLEANE